MKKRMLALAMALALVVAMLPNAVFAAVSSDYGMKLTGVENAAKTGIILTLSIKGPAVAYDAGKCSIGFKIDSTKLRLIRTNGNAASISTTGFSACAGTGKNLDTEEMYLSSVAVMAKEDTAKNVIYLAMQPAFNGTAQLDDYTNLMSVTLAYQNGATADSLDMNSIRLVTVDESYMLGQNNIALIMAVTPSSGYQHGINDRGAGEENLAAPVITYPGSDKTVSVPLTGVTVSLDKSTLEVNGTTGGTVTATATAVPSDATLSNLAYSVSPTGKGVTINASTGAVTVAKDATAGTYTVTASAGGKSGTATFSVTRAPAALTTFTATVASNSVKLPQAGATASTGNVTFTMKDQYGAAMTGTPTAKTLPTGVTYSGGKLVVADTASVANNQTVTFEVTIGGVTKTADAKVSVTQGNGPAAPTGLTATDAATKGGNGTLNNTTADMEYSANGTSGWQNCTAGSTSVKAGTYYVRYKATTKYAASANSAALVVGQPGTSTTPAVSVTGGGQLTEGGSLTLTATVTNAASCTGTLTYKWYKDNVAIDGATSSTYAATEAGIYKCEVTHTNGANDPATGSGTATVTAATAKPAVTVSKKPTASQNEGALNKEGLVTVTGGKWSQVSDVVTATVYKFVPAVEDDSATTEVDETAAAYYEEVTGSLTAGVYYVDVAVVAKNEDTYKVDAVAGAGAPNDATAPADLSGYVVLTVNKKAVSSGGGSSVTKYTVTYDAGAHGKLSGSATERVETGKTPTKVPSVVADEGYKFTGWTQNGKSVNPTSVKITAATTFVAEYGPAERNAYIKGLSERSFGPAMNATRGELATMLARLSKDYNADGNYTSTAPDVRGDAWYANAVNFAINKGIMNGFEDGQFRPTENIRRGEFSAMLARYLGLGEVSGEYFTDVTDHWAAGYINALARAGIVSGFEDGEFKAQELLTRAQAVKMINLAVGMKYDANADYDIDFDDVAEDAWYHEFVMPAANLDVKDFQR